MRYWRCIRLRGIEMPTMLGFHRSDSWPERWALLEQLPRYTCGLAAAGFVGTVTKCIYWKWRRNKSSGAGVVENSSGRQLFAWNTMQEQPGTCVGLRAICIHTRRAIEVTVCRGQIKIYESTEYRYMYVSWPSFEGAC